MEVEFRKVIEDIITLYQKPYSEETHPYGPVMISGKLNPIKCHELMTEEAYKIIIMSRKFLNQLSLEYRFSTEGRPGYENKEIVIDVSHNFPFLVAKELVTVGIEIGVNEGNGMEVVAPSCIEQPVLELSEAPLLCTPYTKSEVEYKDTQLRYHSNPISQNLMKEIREAAGGSSIKGKQILDRVFLTVSKKFGFDTLDATAGSSEVDKFIVDNIASHLKDLKNDKGGTNFAENQHAISSILLGVCAPTEESHFSNVKIANRLGVQDKQIAAAKLKRDRMKTIIISSMPLDILIDALVENEDELEADDIEDDESECRSECSSDSSYYSSDDDDEFEETYSDYGDDNDEIFIEEERNEEENVEARRGLVEMLGEVIEAKKRKKNPYGQITRMKNRAKRSDATDLSVIYDFVHRICRLDTFNKKRVLVQHPDGYFEFHMIHVQLDSIDDMHVLFLKSDEYSVYQSCNMKKTKEIGPDGKHVMKPRTIGKTVFRRGICPCCRKCVQRDCANYKIVTLYLLLTALAKLREKLKEKIANCNCRFHSNPLYLNMHKSIRAFKEYVMCEEVEHGVLKRKAKSEFSRSELEKIETDKQEADFKEKEEFRMPGAVRPSRPKAVRQKTASFEGRIGIHIEYCFY
jgi:hypothetical protein